MDDYLKERIEDIIGNIHTTELLQEQGCTSEVSRVVTSEGAYLLKSSFEDRYRIWLMEEAKVLEKIKLEKQIPVPDFYGFIEGVDSSHLVMSFEEGTSLTSALKAAKSLSEQKSLIKSFGQFLHQFHRKKPLGIFDQDRDWLDRQLDKACYYLKNGHTEGTQELFNQLIERRPLPVQQTMVHGDCTTDNVFVKNGEVKLFIDVAGMTVGDPRYDISLAIRDFIDIPELLNAFYEGYTGYRVSAEEFRYFDKGLYEFF
jgi:aminoglycoside phosphotransferase (APT) family kinase protein